MLACDMEVDYYIKDIDKRVKLAPFSMFFIARKTMDALMNRTPMPAVFLQVCLVAVRRLNIFSTRYFEYLLAFYV